MMLQESVDSARLVPKLGGLAAYFRNVYTYLRGSVLCQLNF